MKVYEDKSSGVSNFYLSQSRYFSNLVELVTCYEQTSLGENFMGYAHFILYYWIIILSFHSALRNEKNKM